VPAFEDLLRCGHWVVLGEQPHREIVLGAAGRFWTPAMDWQQVTLAEFATFSRPRRGTIAVAFSVLPYGPRRSLLTFETRSTVADPVARRWAEWYWHTIKPAARLAAREILHAIRDAATGPRRPSQP
jgi:hypothetical protein